MPTTHFLRHLLRNARMLRVNRCQVLKTWSTTRLLGDAHEYLRNNSSKRDAIGVLTLAQKLLF